MACSRKTGCEHELFECPELFDELTVRELVEGQYNKIMFYFYILKNETGQFYVGQTNNLERRLHDHQNHYGAQFVRSNGQFKLIYCENYVKRKEAMQRERQVKGWTVAKKEALTRGDITELVSLSKNSNNVK